VIDGCLAVSVDQLLSSLQFPSFRPPPSSVTVSRPSSTLAPLQQPRVPSVSNHLPVQGCFYFSHSYLWIVYDVRNIFLPLAIIYPHKAAFTFYTVTYESVYHLRNIFLPLTRTRLLLLFTQLLLNCLRCEKYLPSISNHLPVQCCFYFLHSYL
jgi:hypothetical protein